MLSVIFILAAATVAQSYNIRPLEPWRSNTGGKPYKVSDVSISLPDEALGELFFSTAKDRDGLVATKIVQPPALTPPPMLAHDFLSPVCAIFLNTFLLYFYKLGKHSK